MDYIDVVPECNRRWKWVYSKVQEEQAFEGEFLMGHAIQAPATSRRSLFPAFTFYSVVIMQGWNHVLFKLVRSTDIHFLGYF